MKTMMFYFAKALANWCKSHKWDKDLPITPAFLSMILDESVILMEKDRKELEQTETSTR
jgi:hypothetical protein